MKNPVLCVVQKTGYGPNDIVAPIRVCNHEKIELARFLARHFTEKKNQEYRVIFAEQGIARPTCWFGKDLDLIPSV